MSMPTFPDGSYDDSGHWQRYKYCIIDCGSQCSCKPPFGVWYSRQHDKRPESERKNDLLEKLHDQISAETVNARND